MMIAIYDGRLTVRHGGVLVDPVGQLSDINSKYKILMTIPIPCDTFWDGSGSLRKHGEYAYVLLQGNPTKNIHRTIKISHMLLYEFNRYDGGQYQADYRTQRKFSHYIHKHKLLPDSTFDGFSHIAGGSGDSYCKI
jgi:hypothetical protein